MSLCYSKIMSFITTPSLEKKVIRLSLISFWSFFWLFNVIDKFIGGSTFLWAGKDRYAQFIEHFSSIGIKDPAVASGFLIFVTITQIVALILMVSALIHLIRKDESKTRQSFFWGIIVSLFIFTFFSIGDQIFGDRVELLEHTIFWMVLIVSWITYTYFSPNSK